MTLPGSQGGLGRLRGLTTSVPWTPKVRLIPLEKYLLFYCV